MKIDFLTIILITLFTILMILNYISITKEKNSMKIVNEMGIGYNLGNSFDSYDFYKEIKNPDEQITLLGNPIPTKKLISNIKKYGFKTIRFPITWINFLDDFGNINSNWMARVKQVVKWIVDKKIYCIINLYHDDDSGNWITDVINSKNKYINFWSQIAEEFKDFNEYLIFESMNKALILYQYFYYDYNSLFDLTQSFVDTIRNSGGYNTKRLLIISGMNADITLTCNTKYRIPVDPYNKIAISIHYYIPSHFTSYGCSFYDNCNKWGARDEYKELLENFETLKTFYIDKGIPIIIGEIGVVTEENKEIESIREYLYAIFSLSIEYNGIMACLWDTSNKIYGNMNYYNRETDEWYDEKIKNIFYKISRGKNPKLSQFYISTNLETAISTNEYGFYLLKIGTRKALKIILNISNIGKLFDDYYFEAYCFDKNMNILYFNYGKNNGKKQYDGSIIYTIDISDKDCTDFIEIYKWYGDFNFNNVTIEYKESFFSFDYMSYKAEITDDIK